MLKMTVRGLAVYDGKLLSCRIRGKEYWCLPGGKTDPNESIYDALDREMIEETGIKPRRGELLYVNQFAHSEDVEFVEFFFAIDNPEDYLKIDLSKTTHGEDELEEIGFVDPSVVGVLPSFLQHEIQGYIADGFTSTKFRISE